MRPPVSGDEESLLSPSNRLERNDTAIASHGGWISRRMPAFLFATVGAMAATVLYTSFRQDGLGSALTNLLDLDDDDPYLEITDSCKFNCGGATLTFPEDIYSKSGVLEYTLKVRAARYHGPLSYNTRSYSKNGFPGPTLHVKPGDEIKLTLKNDLEFPTQADITWEGYEYDISTALGACEPYTAPNVTSLHMHGMLVNPNKKGDSPMRMCGPQESIQYEFSIPVAHPAGTFFYHPHADGSTSIQTAGLMAGIVIVDDTVEMETQKDEKGLVTRTGNRVDAVYVAHIAATIESLSALDDIPMLLQWQMVEATFKNYDFLSRCSHSSMPVNQVAYDGAAGSDFMLINGWYKPHHAMIAGVFQRWRLVNGMAHRYVGLKIPDECEAYAIASDGIYYKQPRKQTFVGLSLGARMDLLIACHDNVKLVSEEPSWMNGAQYNKMFGTDPGFYESSNCMTVNVTDGTSKVDAKKIKASNDIRKRITDGTFAMDHGYFGMDLTDGTDEEWAVASGGEYVATDEQDTAAFYNPKLGESPATVTEWYTMNAMEYNGRIQRRMRLNQLNIWNITHNPTTIMGYKKNHNWHLHSYHFQVIKATDWYGRTYYESPMKDWKSGDWRDTVSVPANGTVFVRFKPIRFTGLILHHCHIYNHETAGMKEMVAVVDCSASTLRKMKEAMCESIDDDDRIRRLSTGESENAGDMKSVMASKSTSDTVWPWFEQDTKSQCKGTIDFICSNSGMTMDYSKAYDKESN